MGAAPTEIAVRREGAKRLGFFTDTTTCIGCKSCEVACKQWNDLPADELQLGKGRSYDYTKALSASTWRHVRFVETVKTPQMPDLPVTAGAFSQPAPGPKDEVGPSLVEIATQARCTSLHQKVHDWSRTLVARTCW